MLQHRSAGSPSTTLALSRSSATTCSTSSPSTKLRYRSCQSNMCLSPLPVGLRLRARLFPRPTVCLSTTLAAITELRYHMFYVITFDEAPLLKLSIKHVFIATFTRVPDGPRLNETGVLPRPTVTAPLPLLPQHLRRSSATEVVNQPCVYRHAHPCTCRASPHRHLTGVLPSVCRV